LWWSVNTIYFFHIIFMFLKIKKIKIKEQSQNNLHVLQLKRHALYGTNQRNSNLLLMFVPVASSDNLKLQWVLNLIRGIYTHSMSCYQFSIWVLKNRKCHQKNGKTIGFIVTQIKTIIIVTQISNSRSDVLDERERMRGRK